MLVYQGGEGLVVAPAQPGEERCGSRFIRLCVHTRDHGVQPNASHSLVAGEIGEWVMLAASLSAGLTTRSRPVMQPAAPRRARSSMAVATRVAELGGICFCVMLDLLLSVTLGIMSCRAFTSRYTSTSTTD